MADIGRPTTLTPEIHSAIVESIRAGNYLQTAAEQQGVSINTLNSWLRRGKQGHAPFADFAQAVTRAKADAEVMLLSVAAAGDAMGTSNGPAKCAQWVLERTRPKRFAARINVKIEEELESLLDVVERVCAAKDCGCHQAILEAVAARAGGEEVGDDPSEVAAPVH